MWIQQQKCAMTYVTLLLLQDGGGDGSGKGWSHSGGLYSLDSSPHKNSIANSISSKHTKLTCLRSLTPKR